MLHLLQEIRRLEEGTHVRQVALRQMFNRFLSAGGSLDPTHYWVRAQHLQAADGGVTVNLKADDKSIETIQIAEKVSGMKQYVFVGDEIKKNGVTYEVTGPIGKPHIKQRTDMDYHGNPGEWVWYYMAAVDSNNKLNLKLYHDTRLDDSNSGIKFLDVPTKPYTTNSNTSSLKNMNFKNGKDYFTPTDVQPYPNMEIPLKLTPAPSGYENIKVASEIGCYPGAKNAFLRLVDSGREGHPVVVLSPELKGKNRLGYGRHPALGDWNARVVLRVPSTVHSVKKGVQVESGRGRGGKGLGKGGKKRKTKAEKFKEKLKELRGTLRVHVVLKPDIFPDIDDEYYKSYYTSAFKHWKAFNMLADGKEQILTEIETKFEPKYKSLVGDTSEDEWRQFFTEGLNDFAKKIQKEKKTTKKKTPQYTEQIKKIVNSLVAEPRFDLATPAYYEKRTLNHWKKIQKIKLSEAVRNELIQTHFESKPTSSKDANKLFKTFKKAIRDKEKEAKAKKQARVEKARKKATKKKKAKAEAKAKERKAKAEAKAKKKKNDPIRSFFQHIFRPPQLGQYDPFQHRKSMLWTSVLWRKFDVPMQHTGESVVQVHRWDLKAVPIYVIFTSDGQLPEIGDVIQQGPSCFGKVVLTKDNTFKVLTTTPDFTPSGQLTIFGNFETVLSYTTRTCDYSNMDGFWKEVKGVEVGPPVGPPVGGPRVVHEEGPRVVHEEVPVVHEEGSVVHESPGLLSIPFQTDPLDPPLQSGQMRLPWLEVKNSDITDENGKPIGKGLFAKQTFPENTPLSWYDGYVASFNNKETSEKRTLPGYTHTGEYSYQAKPVRLKNDNLVPRNVYIDASTRDDDLKPVAASLLNSSLFLGAHYANSDPTGNAGVVDDSSLVFASVIDIPNGQEIFWDYEKYRKKANSDLSNKNNIRHEMQKANDDMANFVKSGRAAPVEDAWAPHTFYWKSGDPDLTDSQWTRQSGIPINLPPRQDFRPQNSSANGNTMTTLAAKKRLQAESGRERGGKGLGKGIKKRKARGARERYSSPVEIEENDIKTIMTILGKMSPEESLITIPTETNETNPEKMDLDLIDLDLSQGLEGDPEHSTKVANWLSFDEQGVQSSFDSETANVDSVGPLDKMTDDEIKQALFKVKKMTDAEQAPLKGHKLVETMDLGRKTPEDFLNEALATLAEMGN